LYKSPANTLFVGKNVVFVPECHSTNTLAAQLSQNTHVSEGTVVITRHQTAGRGQRGNTWTVEPGQNLTLSILLKPGFLAIKNQFFLNIITSLAVHDTLVEYFRAADISIKWPNDVLVHGNKICGILIENQLTGTTIQTSIAGIGLNVNQINFELPTATSIALQLKRQFDLQNVFELLLSNIEARYLQLKQQKYAALRGEYLNSLYRRGEMHTFESSGVTFNGEIVGIDEEGRLAVNVESEMKYFEVKQIRYL
jgi:BirA family transcriptional regulator, biotin operon repressor / biotin---[acetyl-CoA-carboxylase] ligase